MSKNPTTKKIVVYTAIFGKKDNLITMDFPSWKPSTFNDYDSSVLSQVLGGAPVTNVYKYRDLLRKNK